MKRLSTIMMFLLAMMVASLSAKAQEVTITLFPGWNWISYPKAETQDISTALGDFEPVNGDMLKSQFGNAVYSNGYWRGSVTHFIPGWGYKYYSNRTEVVSFVFGAAAPQLTVTTAEPTEITANSAGSGGSITSNDGNYIYVFMKGICWATHPNPMVMNDSFTESGSGAESFTAEMTDLAPNTEYYVRAYVVTLDGTTYGEELSFTTRDGIPSVSTAIVTDIMANSAVSGGTVTDDGGLEVTARGLCWSTNPNPTIDDSHTTDSVGIGNFISSIIGLTLNTTYYVRAYASTSYGTGYGEEKVFTTRDGIPVVSTTLVTNIMVYCGTCSGIVIDNGGMDVIARGVCWSIFPNPTLSDNYTINDLGLGVFTSSITGLSAGTTYYVRAYATTSFTTNYGEEMTFRTKASGGNTPAGSISGVFSVSDSLLVYFSQGNLQYIGSANTPYWKFADNQWDYLGTTTGQNSGNPNIDRDLFGWGTSGWHDNSDPYNVNYQPWAVSDSLVNENYNYYGYGPSTNMLSPNLTDSSAYYDWGVYNSISNGGNLPNQWRMLTRSEWNYLFKVRSTISGIRFVKARVNGVNGVIILPDDWATSYFTLNNPNIYPNVSYDYNDNIISASDWTDNLEANGAVFLPAAGYRHNGTSVTNVNSYGHYWSSQYINKTCASHLFFVSFNLVPNVSNFTRDMGFSVRLVCPIEN